MGLTEMHIPRGTCKAYRARLFSRTDSGKTEIEMGENDYLVLTVREIASESSPILLRVEGQKGKNIIALHENETDLPVGKYSADIRLYKDDCTYSIWGTDESDTREKNLKNFIILAGVGENE